MATTRAIIDVDKKELAIRSGKEYEILKFPSMRRGKMKQKEECKNVSEEEIKEPEGQGLPSTS